MRINAYVMLADPSFLTASIRAYYDHVDRNVVSHDANARSWTGTALPIDETLALIESLDSAGKCELHPGAYARAGFDPMDNETHQRNEALAVASEGADWVLQLDTDEVIPRASAFLQVLRHADEAGASGLEYPSRATRTCTMSCRSTPRSSITAGCARRSSSPERSDGRDTATNSRRPASMVGGCASPGTRCAPL